MRAAFKKGMRGDKLAYLNGMDQGILVNIKIRQSAIAAHRLKHTATKVKIRHATSQLQGSGLNGCHRYSGKYPWPWPTISETARLTKRFDGLVPLEGFLAL